MLLLQSIFILPAISILWQATSRGSTPIGVILILVLLVILLFWWGINRPSYDQMAQPADHHDAPAEQHVAEVHERAQMVDIHAVPEATAVIEEVPAVFSTPDDLKRVEGIGPKIESILNEAGIQTFAQLAATEVSQLEKIVREDAGISVAYPDSWPKQAQLAATGDWEAFAKLQDELQGGRKR